jgi:hypothetical protein
LQTTWGAHAYKTHAYKTHKKKRQTLRITSTRADQASELLAAGGQLITSTSIKHANSWLLAVGSIPSTASRWVDNSKGFQFGFSFSIVRKAVQN